MMTLIHNFVMKLIKHDRSLTIIKLKYDKYHKLEYRIVMKQWRITLNYICF